MGSKLKSVFDDFCADALEDGILSQEQSDTMQFQLSTVDSSDLEEKMMTILKSFLGKGQKVTVEGLTPHKLRDDDMEEYPAVVTGPVRSPAPARARDSVCSPRKEGSRPHDSRPQADELTGRIPLRVQTPTGPKDMLLRPIHLRLSNAAQEAEAMAKLAAKAQKLSGKPPQAAPRARGGATKPPAPAAPPAPGRARR